MTAANPQSVASNPQVSAFVTANAGSGKTSTLVNRVARLLLRDAAPETILCVTYTKAAAAEMQRRLFDTLGAWAVMEDQPLFEELARIDEAPTDLAKGRRLFARALETPGGLKIQTIHAFCEKLLRRFPLEAGVAPGFRVLEDQAAREVSALARREVAQAAIERPDGDLGRAYAKFSVELDHRSFQLMFAEFEARRTDIEAYVKACAEDGGVEQDVWRKCGFDIPSPSAGLEAEALDGTDLAGLRGAAAALAGGGKTDGQLAERIGSFLGGLEVEEAGFDELWRLYCTQDGKPRASLATKAIPEPVRAFLAAEQARLGEANEQIKAARTAEDTLAALYLAAAYAELYEGAKRSHGGLDFGDLIRGVHELLTQRADAAWVLYKLDGGVDHILVDEAQDTAPSQWDIARALTSEFFAGAGVRPAQRTVFAVGDEKQSIFSFQGADPGRFLRERGEYELLVERAGQDFAKPRLARSFRSAPEILDFVDAVFADPEIARALTPEAAEGRIRHEPTRPAGRGTVDLWPLEETDPVQEADPWAPVDAAPALGANKKLARRIADEVKAMQARGEAVWDKDLKAWRPMAFGDVLILVRRRNALFHEIIRALKARDVPVGGADRLTLSDHILFADLLGLARFCLYPDDDLTLAALLRSPLCDVDEDSLFALAWNRSGRLWGELRRRAGERPEWEAALATLERARTEARVRPPFDFYARLLNRTDPLGRSMRSRFLTRLGREAEQALDAFLAEALAAERRGVRDLERFAADMAFTAVEVKREQQDGRGEVRVMTVHGAKGLEAPIVILPDTTTRASAQGGPLLDFEDGFLWQARKADDCAASAAARQTRADKADHESLRLLYVALTRARDRLIICGVMPGRAGLREGSWDDVVRRALEHPDVAPQVRELPLPDGRSMLRFGADPQAAGAPAAAEPPVALLPSWASRPAPAESPLAQWAAPSHVADMRKGPSPSPLDMQAGLGRFRRGELIHRLLEILPDLATARRAAAAMALLEREPDLAEGQRREMAAAALAVLEDPQFAAVFGPGSRAEAAIAGSAPELPAGLAVSGRIDRLLVEPDRVLVVDYKTNRPSPNRIEDADPVYVAQMAVYAAVLREIFPGRRVEAALVWTDGPKLMPVPEILMAQALQALPRSG